MVKLFKEKQMKWSTNAEPSAAIPGKPILFLNGDSLGNCDACIFESQQSTYYKPLYYIYVNNHFVSNKYFKSIEEAKQYIEELLS